MKKFLLAGALPLALILAPAALAADATFDMSTDVGYVSVDASVTHDVTPDMVSLNVSCDLQEPATRDRARAALQQKMADLKAFVGSDATMRRNGAISIYNYGYMGDGTEASFSGNISFTVKNLAPALTAKIMDQLDAMNCTGTWDVRLNYAGKYAMMQKDELMEQIADKRSFYESLIGQKLTRVSSVSFYTSLDSSMYYGGGYGAQSAGNYDPETNTAQAVTTLNVTYVTGPVVTPAK